MAWFAAAFDEEPQDLDVLKKRLQSAIRFDARIMDAESRVGRMLDGLMRALEEDNQEWLLYQEGKMVVDVITKAIKPEPLQKTVQKQLQLQRKKPLKSDVFRFLRWLRQFAAGFQVYVGLEEETPKPPKNRTPDPLLKNQGKRSKDGKSGGGSGSGKGKPDNPTKPPAGPDAADATKKKRLGCLKCGDETTRLRTARRPRRARMNAS